MNIWGYISDLLGSGLHWGKCQSRFRRAIEKAEKDGYHDAAEHLRIMLELRNRVMFEDKEKDSTPEGGVKSPWEKSREGDDQKQV